MVRLNLTELGMYEDEKVLLAEVVSQSVRDLEMQLVEVNLTELLELDVQECMELLERLASREYSILKDNIPTHSIGIISEYDLVVGDDVVVYVSLTQEMHTYFLELTRVLTVDDVCKFIYFNNEYSGILYYTIQRNMHYKDNNYYSLTELYELFDLEDYSLSEIKEVLCASAKDVLDVCEVRIRVELEVVDNQEVLCLEFE